MKITERILRFALVGALCFVIQWGIVYLLISVMHLYFADVIAFLISAQLNFLLSQTFTWGDRPEADQLIARWLKFNTSALASAIIVNATTFWLLITVGLWYWVALFIANAASTTFTFIMNHFVVFKNNTPLIPPEELKEVMPTAIQSAAFFLPAHNEAENLPGVVARVHQYFDTADITHRTVIIVDDGSTDHTAEVITNIKQTHPVTVVRHEVNRGYGGALRSGLKAALETGHDWIAFCDSDGQFDPSDLALLFAAAEQHNAHVVIGYRAERADNWRRRVTGRAWHALSSFALGFTAQDVDCGFKLFHRDAIHPIEPHLRGEHATISPELLARLHRTGHRFVEVAIPHYPRAHGEQTGTNFRVMWGSLVGLYLLRRQIL